MGEDIIISTKVDLGDAPQTIGNLKKEFIAARQEIYNTTKGTNEYFIALQHAAEVKGEITKLNREIKLLNPEEKLKGIAEIGIGAVGAFTAANGAIELFGNNNQKLTEVLRKTQGAMALLQGLVAFEKGIRSARTFINVMGVSKKITLANAAAQKALGTAQEGAAEGTKVATTATKGFGTALKATGIGLLISALAYLIANFDDVKKTMVGLFPALGNLGQVFDKVKAAIFGVGGAVIKAIIAPFKAVMKIIHGDFKGALNELEDGFNIAKNFSEEYASKSADIADEHRKDQIRKETEQTDKLIEVLDARGKDTYKLESENYKKKLSILEKGSKEYDELLQQQSVFEAKNLKTRDDNAAKAAEKAAAKAKEAAAKKLELQKQYALLSAKIDKDLADAEALTNPAGAALNKYKRDLVDIAASQKEEKQKLDQFLKSKIISLSAYNTQVANLENEANNKIKIAQTERDKGLADESKKVADAQLKILKNSQAAQETILEEQYAHKKITKQQFEDQLFLLNTVALNKEKALLIKNGQDTSDIDKRLADNDIKILENAEKLKAAIIDKANKKSLLDYKISHDRSIINRKLTIKELQKLENDAFATAISNTSLTEEQKTQLEKDHSQARIEIAKKEQEVKKALASSAASLLDSAAEALGKNTAKGKALAIAATTISTFQGAQAAFTGMISSIPGPVGIGLGVAAAAAALVAGISRVKAISKIKTPGGSVGSESNPVYTAPSNPAFTATAPSVGNPPTPTTNLSQQSMNQISQGNNGSNQVISVNESDITNTQTRVASYQNASTI